MKTIADDTIALPRRASFGDRALSYTLDGAKSLYRIALRQMKRTQDKVNSEYDGSHWQKILMRKAWRNARSLPEFLVFPDQTRRLRKVNGEIVRISAEQYYRYRLKALAELIGRHAGGIDTLVELGTGYGYNLFSIHSHYPDWTLKGFDISKNGIQIGREIALHFGISDRVSFDFIDITNASDPNRTAICNEVVLTYFCIEQIPYDVRRVVENIILGKPRRVINIEPNAEFLDLRSPRDVVSRLYIRSVDYQTTLFRTLEQLEQERKIRIIARERMPFAPTINNDGMLYCWEPL